jgi:uncharacterized OB-fold protein
MARLPRLAAVDGWFRFDGDGGGEAVRLLGGRCPRCGTYSFPAAHLGCPNPACGETEVEEVELSTRGRVWSYTENMYKPPAPYVAADPFQPYSIAAVELDEERMVVLGQVVPDAPPLHIGMAMELVLGTLFEDEQAEYVVWKWRPVAEPSA